MTKRKITPQTLEAQGSVDTIRVQLPQTSDPETNSNSGRNWGRLSQPTEGACLGTVAYWLPGAAQPSGRRDSIFRRKPSHPRTAKAPRPTLQEKPRKYQPEGGLGQMEAMSTRSKEESRKSVGKCQRRDADHSKRSDGSAASRAGERTALRQSGKAVDRRAYGVYYFKCLYQSFHSGVHCNSRQPLRD